jgi:formate/nitrite transporter FocA (FNT family)
VTSRDPEEIWQESVEEGERRVGRSVSGLVATGLLGGLDVMLGIVGLTVVSGAFEPVLPEESAHVIGSLAFGIGFVLLIVGRSELFTENFLVPITTVISTRRGGGAVLRLWAGTLVGNLVALMLLAALLTRAGLVPPSALDTASSLAETFAERDFISALLSAIVAGALMTLLTWSAHGADDDISRVAVALFVGFMLAAPSLNHAVVGVGEMAFGLFADRGSAKWVDLLQNFPVAVLGNLIGGMAFVTAARLVQVRGEPS